MHVQASTDRPLATGADTVAVGVFEEEARGDELGPAVAALLDSGEAGAAFSRVASGHHDGRRVIVAGLGRREDFDAERARIAAALVQRRAGELRAQTLCWAIPDGLGDQIVAGLVEGTLLAAYRFRHYKPRPRTSPPASNS